MEKAREGFGPQTLTPLAACPTGSYGDTVLEAHRSLTECDPSNGPRFKDVIEFLEEDLRKKAAVSDGAPDPETRRNDH